MVFVMTAVYASSLLFDSILYSYVRNIYKLEILCMAVLLISLLQFKCGIEMAILQDGSSFKFIGKLSFCRNKSR